MKGRHKIGVRDIFPNQKYIRRTARDFVSVYTFFGVYFDVYVYIFSHVRRYLHCIQVYIDVYMGYTQCTGVYRCIHGVHAVHIDVYMGYTQCNTGVYRCIYGLYAVHRCI